MNYTSIPSPVELGLPEKFDRWRTSQEQMLLDSLNSTARFDGINAPTGIGKSLFWMGRALITKERTVILTKTKGLMLQAMADFQSAGLVSVMGKGNYKCTVGDDWTCEHGHHGSSCLDRGTPACGYSGDYFRVLGSNIIVTNYSYWIAVNKYSTGLGVVDHLILDEAHEAHGAISDAISVYLSEDDLKLMQQRFPTSPFDLNEWRAWARRILPEVQLQQQVWEAKIAREPKPSWIKNFNRLLNIERKLATLALIRPDHWVVEQSDKGYQLDPIRISAFAEKTLYRNIPKITFLSATIRPKTMLMCEVERGKFNFFEYDSPFPVENRPVYYVPTVALKYGAGEEDLAMWAMRHDQIFAPRLDRKHIVHTGSYERRKDLVLRSKFARYMHYNVRGDITDDLVRRFKGMDPPAILVSPSVGTGYDFPGKDCECQIIDKVPFPPRQKLVVAAREAIDKEYSIYHAIQDLVQASGRPTRSEKDRAETFIIDNNIEWVMNRYPYLAPKWFVQAYSREAVIPRPLPVN